MTRPRGGHSAREQVHYSCRVIRSVERGREGAARALLPLMDNTGRYVEYETVGKIGVTLVQLDPVLRSILGKDKRGAAALEGMPDFQAELRDKLDHAQYGEYAIPVSPEMQLGLYGRDSDVLGLRLSADDYRLRGDHAVVKAYIDDTYAHENESTRERFLQANRELDLSYIALGRVKLENMGADEASDFRADPTEFLAAAAEAEMNGNRERYGDHFVVHDITYPETVAFNGLSVVCHQIS
jgi:hypothetical protein